MSFRSGYQPSETDDQQPHSLGYTGLNHHPSGADHSISDLYGSQNPLNSSLNTSFMNNSNFYATPSRSYSVQDFASLPGLTANAAYGTQAIHPAHPQHQHTAHPLNAGPYQMANGPYPASSPYIDPAYAEWLVRYKQWYDYVENMRRERMRQMQPVSERARLTPHRYPHRHTRVSFGGSNQLITAKGTVLLVQQIDPSLIDLEEEIQVTTWPGPLIKGETKKDDALEYIRTRESVLKHDQNPESYFKSHERKQIWSLLSMIVRQNGILSGADLSELLLTNNENEFETPDEGDEIAKLRRYLTLGQKKTALEFAQKTGLWGHVTSLILFMTAAPSPSADSLVIQFSKVVSKFMNSTLSREDPLFILYRSLLTKIQSPVTAASAVTSAGNNSSKQQQVTTETLQQFAILLANDCDVSPSVQDYSRASELLKLIVSIKNNATQHVVNLANLDLENEGSEKSFRDLDQNYSDELVFINEIWEFARPQTEFIERLVPLKALLASRLFDFGLSTQASRYCYAIRQYFTYYSHYFPGRTISDSVIDWDVVIDVVTDLECRIYGYDVTKGANDQSNITDKRSEVEEEKSIAGETDAGTAADDTDLDDEEMDESEQEKQPELPVHQNIRPSSKQHSHQSNLMRRESQLSTTSAGTSAGERSRAPSSISQTNTVTNGNRLPRTRTISRETASPPTSPVKSLPGPQNIPFAGTSISASATTFQPLSVADRSSPPAGGQGNFFVPPALSAEPIPEFNFVSSYVPTSSAESPLSPNFSDDFRADGESGRRDSITPFIHNSTAVPGLTSPGQFPNAFSPIAAPQPADQSGKMNGFNQSHQNQSSSFYSQSQQNHQQQQSNRPVRPSEPTGGNLSARDSPEPQERSMNKTGGWFNNLIRKVVPPGAKQAVLPDDKEPSIVYDERLKRWIDKNGASDNQLLDAIQNGPPRMPTGMTSATSMPQLPTLPAAGSAPAPAAQPMPNGGPANNFSFMTGPNRRKPQYVDVWQQQQKQHPARN